MTPQESAAIQAEELAYHLRSVSEGEYRSLRSIARKLRAGRSDFTDPERFIAETYSIPLTFTEVQP